MSNSHTDTEDSLRRWVAKREGVTDVSEPIWQMIDEDRLIAEWHNEDPELRNKVRDEILVKYRRYKRFVRDTGGSASSTPEVVREDDSTSLQAELSPNDPVSIRAETLCLYWAKLAEAERRVRQFREVVLGGDAVSESTARDFVHSPATAVFSLKFFRERRIPTVGHTVEVLSHETSNPYERPPWARAKFKVTWADGEAFKERSWAGGLETKLFWDGKELVPVVPWPFSPMWRLHRAAVELCRHYPWETPDAAWLILTGEAPWVPPLTGRISGPDPVRNHGTITITAAHWVPKDAVSAFYVGLKSRHKAAPTPLPRKLAIFRFVVERSRGVNRWEPSEPNRPDAPLDVYVRGIDAPPWRSLLAEWNGTYPEGHEWHYQDVRNFSRDYRDASQALLGY